MSSKPSCRSGNAIGIGTKPASVDNHARRDSLGTRGPGAQAQTKLGQNLGQYFGKLVRSAIWVRMHRFSAQTEPWRPKTDQIPFLGNQLWGNIGHILANFMETIGLWIQMAWLKRCAPKNDPENRWNFVEWTNDGPKLTLLLSV